MMNRLSQIIVPSVLTLLAASVSLAVAPTVTVVSPTAQTITADVAAPIIMTFDAPLDPASVNNTTMRVFGRWSGPTRGMITFENSDMTVRFTPDEPFFAGEWITVALSRGVTNAAGDSLANGFWCNYWTRAEPGTLDLIEVERIPVRLPLEAHIQSYGAYAGDLNDDGWSDLIVPNELAVDLRVFLNDGAGGYSDFSIHSLPGGSSPSTNEGGDFNGDYLIDFAVGNGGNSLMHVLVGNGNGGFDPATSYTASSSVRGLAIIDLDADGYDDIVTANRNGSNLSIFMGHGDGTFAAATNMDVGTAGETACAVGDANEDGIPDLFVASRTSAEMAVLLGDGHGGLTVSDVVSIGGLAWMVAIGDVNNDGHVDIVSSNSTSNSCSVIFGDGLGGLGAAQVYPTGNFTIAIDLGDLDGDGDLDLVTSNYSGNNWTMYENDGTGAFINRRSFPAASTGSCATLHDRDNDGDLDMTGLDETDDLMFIFENTPVLITADTTFGKVPLDVQFLGTTPHTVNTWDWDFGDGNVSTTASPTHRYTQPGLHSVSVNIGTPGGSFSDLEPGLVYALAETLTVANVAAVPSQSVRVDVSINNHVPLKEVTIPFHWPGPFGLLLDSVTTTGLRTANLTEANGGLDNVVDDFPNKRAIRRLTAPAGSPIASGSGPILSLYFRTPPVVLAGANLITIAPFGLVETSLSMIPGSIVPEIVNGSISFDCCLGSTGNIDNDPADITDIADLTFLIDNLFINFTALPCPDEANIDGDLAGVVDIADLTFLIDNLFINFTPTAVCP